MAIGESRFMNPAHSIQRFRRMGGTLLAVWLTAAAGGTGGCARQSAPTPPHAPVQRVGVDEFVRASAQPEVVVLDVRTPAEFAEGHLPGAVNVNVNAPDFDAAITELDRERVTLVYCRSGRRSARACARMQEAGFEHLLELAPGYAGWVAAGQATAK
jgi:rhodanese-related sulfurtransferase